MQRNVPGLRGSQQALFAPLQQIGHVIDPGCCAAQFGGNLRIAVATLLKHPNLLHGFYRPRCASGNVFHDAHDVTSLFVDVQNECSNLALTKQLTGLQPPLSADQRIRQITMPRLHAADCDGPFQADLLDTFRNGLVNLWITHPRVGDSDFGNRNHLDARRSACHAASCRGIRPANW